MIDLTNFNIDTPTAKDISIGNREGGITFIYHKNGKRIVLSKRILTLLGNPNKINFGFIEDYLIIMPSEGDNGFTLKNMSQQKVIYNAPLIKEILEQYSIAYDDKFCKTFSEVEAVENCENTIAVKMII